jgi:Mn-dependent DtxR family transcriptional regulator
MKEKRLTLERLEALKIIDEISSENEFGVAPIKKIIKLMEIKRGIKNSAVRKLIWELTRMGFVENPILGGYRLTEKGRRALQIEGEN